MSISFQGRPWAAAAWALLVSLPVGAAEPLSLREAQALAAARSQQLVANSASIAASRQMAVAAAQLPDPVLKLGIENLPLSGPERLSLTRDFMTMRRIGLMQEWPHAEKRRLRAERFEREAVRTEAERQLNLANVQRDTALAWLERHYTRQMRELVLQQMQETRLQVQAAESGFGTGRSSQADVFAARAALALLEDRLSQIERQERNAVLALARWVGPDAERPASVAPDWQASFLDHGPIEQHLANHPDLVMLRAQVEQAQTEARLAEANKQSDWSVEAAYGQRGPAYANMVAIGVSIPLQWDPKNRQDRELAARLALVDEARARYEERLRSHDAELRSLINEWRNGKARLARYQDQLIPLARQRSEAALTAYRGGKVDLAAALAARRDEVEVRMQALSLEWDTARAWAQLNFLIPDPSLAAPRQEQP